MSFLRMRGKTIAVHDQQIPGTIGVIELLHPSHLMPQSSVVRDEALGASFIEQSAANVPYAAKVNAPSR